MCVSCDPLRLCCGGDFLYPQSHGRLSSRLHGLPDQVLWLVHSEAVADLVYTVADQLLISLHPLHRKHAQPLNARL